jgi:DNA replication protein DnaC
MLPMQIGQAAATLPLPVERFGEWDVSDGELDAAARESIEMLLAADAERTRQAVARNFLADSCIGERFKGLTFDDYVPVNADAARVLTLCMEFAASFRPGCGRNLIFTGSTGTGKNMLAAIIGQYVMKNGYSFLHTTVMKVVRRYKDGWRQQGVTEESVLRYFLQPDLLVMDEVGVQFDTPTEQLYITELVNDRYEARKSTILLSNLTLKQVEDCLGQRCAERFHEDGSKALIFNWPSWRRQQRLKAV